MGNGSAESHMTAAVAAELRRQQVEVQVQDGQLGALEGRGPGCVAEEAAEMWMAARYEGFVTALAAAGWQTDRVALPRPTWTAEWGATADSGGGAGSGAGHAHVD